MPETHQLFPLNSTMQAITENNAANAQQPLISPVSPGGVQIGQAGPSVALSPHLGEGGYEPSTRTSSTCCGWA